MKGGYWLCCVLLVSLLGPTNAGAQVRHLPRLDGAALLVGYDSLFGGSPSDLLAVTTPQGTFTVLPEPGQPVTNNGTPTHASISSDGRLIGCLRVKSARPAQVVVATYSIPDKVWTEYARASSVLAVAISPDKSKLAVISIVREGDPARLSIIDMRSSLSQVISTEPFPLDGNLSWSPDGGRIAYQVRLSSGGANTYDAAIDVVELGTGMTRRVGRGQDPAWSPSGKWIAYLDSSGTWPVTTKCMVARPDGSGERELYAFPPVRKPNEQQYFIGAPVWSPDSKQLLLNELIDQGLPVINMRRNVHLLDFDTGKLTTRFRKVAPVIGWAAWR